jgi:hypothetical protein
MKTYQIAVAIVCAIIVGAVSTQAQVRFGAKAGLNVSTMSFSRDVPSTISWLPTLQVGAQVDVHLQGAFRLNTGLQIFGKGFTSEATTFGVATSGKANPIYLHVPVTVHYRFDDVFVGAGPYLSYGFAGSGTTTINGSTVDADLTFGSEIESDFAALDYGIGLEAGLDIDALRVSASFNFGLANVIPSYITDIKGSFSVFSLGLGYMF